MSYLSQSEAYAILKLPLGAGKEAVMASYKKLAQHWFPEKHQNSNEAINQFSNISKAYSRLCSDVDRVEMDLETMYKLFSKIAHPKSQKNKNTAFNEIHISSEMSSGVTNNKALKSDKTEKSSNHQETHEDELQDNFRRKKNSELNSTHQSQKSSIPNSLLAHPNFIQVLNTSCEDAFSKSDETVVKSRQFAIDGNALANQGLYGEAISQFSKAIELDCSDFRFYGNRSFCYERQGSFAEALADAEEAIKMAPEWPKGYFRKGKALTGSKNFAEAEEAYLHVLKLDSKCPDAKLELTEVRVQRLMEMGFKKQQAAEAIRQCETVEAALESILNNQVFDGATQDHVVSSEDEEVAKGSCTNSTSASSTTSNKIDTNNVKQQNKKQKQQKAPLPPIPQHHYEQAQRQILLNKQQDVVKMNPRNPEGLTSLWVGNVLPEAKQETLIKLFSKYGQLQSVKCIPEKFCAFINFVNKDCAGRAMENLQGADLFGQKLLIKFPDHPVNPANGEKAPTKCLSKNSQQSRNNALSSLQSSKQVHLGTSNHNSLSLNSSFMANNVVGSTGCASTGCQNSSGNSRATGPVNGDECYFWRTTGCQFTGTCRYKHVPDHKGIDRKPWHKSK